jgi:hypothetical protein
VNPDRHVLVQNITAIRCRSDTERRLVAGVNDTGFRADGQSDDAVGPELKLSNVRREFGFGHVFGRNDGVRFHIHTTTIVVVVFVVVDANWRHAARHLTAAATLSIIIGIAFTIDGNCQRGR